MKSNFNKRLLSSIILLPILTLFIIKGSYLFNVLLICCLMISIYEWQKMSVNAYQKLSGILFLIISFLTIFILRNLDNGLFIFLLITLICISTDIGGFIFGNILKGPKLTKISPNKTYSGVLGSYLLSIILSIIFIDKFQHKFNIEEILSFNLFLFVILISTISQIGDLTISYFKRVASIKDTGTIIPGHGGILDRIDGMIFSYPFSLIILPIIIN